MRLVILDLDELEKDAEWDEYEDGYTAYSESAIKSALVDAERHGHWISDRLWSTNGGTYGVRRCSNCEYYCNDIRDKWNYCPDCGAKMDEKEE